MYRRDREPVSLFLITGFRDALIGVMPLARRALWLLHM